MLAALIQMSIETNVTENSQRTQKVLEEQSNGCGYERLAIHFETG